MDFVVLLLVLIVFYIPTYVFYKKTSCDILEIKRGKYHNVDYLCLLCLLVISTFISVLEVNEVVVISSSIRECFDLFITFILLISLLRHFYYALLERFNKIRIFTWPFLIYIVFWYTLFHFSVDVSIGSFLGFNKHTVASLNVFSWVYLGMALVYQVACVLVPFICYRVRKTRLS